MKRIFKDRILGEPVIQRVLRNKQQGVSGKMLDISKTPRADGSEWGGGTGQPNELFSNQYLDLNYTYHFEVNRFLTNTTGSGYYEVINTYIDVLTSYKFNNKFTIDLNFTSPTYVKEKDIIIKLNYERHSIAGFYYNTIQPSGDRKYEYVFDELYSFASKNKDKNYTEDVLIDTELDKPNLTNWVQPVKDFFTFSPSNLKNTRFGTSFDVNISHTEQGAMHGQWKAYWANPSQPYREEQHEFTVDINFIQPKSIEVIIRGDTLTTTEIAFHVGAQINVFPLPQSTLLTTKSTIKTANGTIPLYQYLANDIINEWHDGKQNMTLTIVVNDNSDIIKVGESVMVMNTRENSYVDDSQSYSRYPDGAARVFVVDSSEIIYDGSLKQNLTLSEKRRE